MLPRTLARDFCYRKLSDFARVSKVVYTQAKPRRNIPLSCPPMQHETLL